MNRRNSIRLLGAVGTLAALAAASPAFGDGALAIDEGDCSRAGVAIGYESLVEAESVALEECGEGCSVVERFTGGCVAFASDESDGNAACGWATGGVSESEAAAAALEECHAAGGTDCVTRLSDCDAAESARLMAGEGPEAPSDPPGSRKPAGETFRDCPNCPQMVVIPAGTFRMGCLSNDDDCYEEEFPVHEVTIRSFALSKHEVTLAQWEACVAAGGCNGLWYEENLNHHPMTNVSWEQAQSFVAWLSELTGHAYRLPTESEWEYAARAGTDTKYSWGSSIGNNQANCDGCGSRWDGDMTAPVGSFGANAFGLHDMHGNVSEWLEDCWNNSYAGAPSDGSAWLSGECGDRVMRGGSWFYDPEGLRSASRESYPTDLTYSSTGFRVARTLAP